MKFIIIILISFFILVTLFKNKIKGIVGEKTTSFYLNFLDKSKYKIISDIVLKNGEKTSQIDHIVISDYGVFVIETKNYKGWIFGNENSEYWTQVLYKKKSRFYNPIKQNYGHIKTLKECLNEFPNLKYKSIIVFSSKADLRINTTTNVITYSKLNLTIRRNSEKNLSEIEQEQILKKIKSLNIINKFDKKEHIKSINKNRKKRENLISQNKCPNCGNTLVLRNGKYSRFLGCNSYPRCKFTKKI